VVETTIIVERLAQAIGVDEDEVVLKGVGALIRSELRKVYAESMEIKQRYGVESADEMDESYRRGVLAEEHSWRDYFRLCHLEERREVLEELLSESWRRVK